MYVVIVTRPDGTKSVCTNQMAGVKPKQEFEDYNEALGLAEYLTGFWGRAGALNGPSVYQVAEILKDD